MGFRLSRLAQAVIALTLCSASVQAAEQSDDFYIEIKGPNKAVQQPAPVQTNQTETTTSQGASGTRQAQPFVPERNDRYAINATTRNYGPVRRTDTAWSISERIRRLYPSENLNTSQVLRALYRKNPRAFGGRRMDNLLAGVRLAIPTLAEIKTAQAVATRPVPAQPATPKPAVVQQPVPQPVQQPAPKVEAPAPVAPVVVSAAQPAVPEVATTVVSASEPTQVQPAAATESKPAVEIQPPEKTVVATTEQGLIDPKVHELVASTETTAEPAVNPLQEEIKVVQTENEELKTRIQELNSQIGALQARAQNQDELNAQIEDLQNKIKALETQPKEAPAPEPEPTEDNFWHDILATPLNLLLLISLPVLAVLVLVSFWLRARSKRELAQKEQEMAETTALAMDDSNSAFDDLLSVDINNDDVIPDLNAKDDLEVPPEIDLSLPDEDEFQSALNQVEAQVQTAELEAEPVEGVDDLPDLNMLDEETALYSGDTLQPESLDEIESIDEPAGKDEYAGLLSDQDLANALEAEFASFDLDNDEIDFSKETEAETIERLITETTLDEEAPVSELDLSIADEIENEVNTAAFDIEKLQGETGVQMEDQIVSEPEGWELPEEEIETLNPSSETEVNLESVKDDEGKDWTKQFEPDDAADEIPDDFVSIDKLLEETNASDMNPDELKANLDVGLDEFPDMLPEQNGVDIDEDGGIGAKLDLARAYLEIDDKESAKELLLEVTEQGSDTQIKEAEKLLSKIG